jgi:DNA mismatch repair protein MutS
MTQTPMGARLLRRWLGRPLLDLEGLLRRQEAIAYFHKSGLRRKRAFEALSRISDVERLLNRIRLGSVLPRELLGLKQSLESVPVLLELLGEGGNGIPWLRAGLDACQDIVGLIALAIRPDPSGEVGEGGIVAEGFMSELDDARKASRSARDVIAAMERLERERTGIRSLKIGYNKVFGYYIEVSNPNLGQVPQHFVRRQTLANGERFITPDLKEQESLIFNARERIEEIEKSLYRQVCQQVAARGEAIVRLGDGVAHIDVFVALAETASRHNYTRPKLTMDGTLDIREGRHPVVERVLPPGTFVPNDARLQIGGEQLLILTGPNMAGKSTYIRQVALIVLMAQIGSFVPASEATIGLVDRIFTRVGLQDDLATGQSTFMVEMVETASILNQATKRSLVILDEVGRGTSTYDGMAIAQAVVEYLHNHPRLGCKVLFATHYHELTEMQKLLPNVRNYSVAVAEKDGKVVFLHKIVSGAIDRSYGIHVAHLAGLPSSVTSRARQVLKELESTDNASPRRRRGERERPSPPEQIPMFSSPHPVVEELTKLDVANMTPIEAMSRLYELQEKAKRHKTD